MGKAVIINMGDKVRDKITGFEGVVTGRSEFITGCDQILVQPKMTSDQIRDGKKADPQWFDDNRLEVIKSGAFDLNASPTAKTGACGVAPVK